ncbi:MAG TPA: type II toxin-antitoxin system RelE/ParE family toxin [Paraburkholderia sp.]|jgi:proteic killer suppression protein|uniref:type II toxin-antitoxin system RelE/ParE family toxin n=1 Tax=Paraburkholderia sp. TaxID=1926495 RepID=UPI002DED904A|nr:type II toxin-antitoxin system RelE/ParE family toxin [Paraburkholderia sp.]
MIKTFRHKGLQAFFLDGNKAGIQAHHAARLRILLTALDAAHGPQDMNSPPLRLHALRGNLRDHWAVWVNGNWRLTFTFEGGDAILLDYQDYH